MILWVPIFLSGPGIRWSFTINGGLLSYLASLSQPEFQQKICLQLPLRTELIMINVIRFPIRTWICHLATFPIFLGKDHNVKKNRAFFCVCGGRTSHKLQLDILFLIPLWTSKLNDKSQFGNWSYKKKSHSDIGSKSLREVEDLRKNEVLHSPPFEFVKHPQFFLSHPQNKSSESGC